MAGTAMSRVDAAGQTRTSVVRLFQGPYVTRAGRRLEVPEGSKRLLVFVALHRTRLERRYVAGTLWPDADDARAAGNLRSTLWRLRGAGIDVIAADKWSLALLDDVVVDTELANDWATRLINGTAGAGDLTIPPYWLDALDLLPGWYDDWTYGERERLRQRTLHALEALSRQLADAGRHAEAVDAAMAAVRAEPLRESAQRVLVEAHLAEGNLVEARRGYQAYRELLNRELGVAPTFDVRTPVTTGVA
ncbi:MAG: transcriptional regulator [Kutzneria sp.]|nr:transcriptional regulator [Kutzneria sp.]